MLVIPALLILLTAQFEFHKPAPHVYHAALRPVIYKPIPTLPPDHLLNTGDADLLDALPGIGPARARNIIMTRETRGPYHYYEDLMIVDGIGSTTIQNIRNALNTTEKTAKETSQPSPAPPTEASINTHAAMQLLNTGDLTALDALPGIGPVIAQRIIDVRNVSGPFNAIEDLLAVDGIGPKKLDQIRESLNVPTATPTIEPSPEN